MRGPGCYATKGTLSIVVLMSLIEGLLPAQSCVVFIMHLALARHTALCRDAKEKGLPRSEGVVGDPRQKTTYQQPATGDCHLQVGRARPRGSNYVPGVPPLFIQKWRGERRRHA